MKNKEYLIVGAGFTAHFPTLKERNTFTNTVNEIYDTQKFDSKYTNLTALHSSISIVIAKKWNVKLDIN